MGRTLVGFVVGLLVVPVIAALVVFSGHFSWEAARKPPRWERRLANLALDPWIESRAKGAVDPVTGSDDDLRRGMKLYRDHCALCHGDPGKPSAYGRNNLYPPAPQFSEHGDRDPVPEIYVVVRYGIRYTGMGAWEKIAPDEDLWRVATFLHRMKSLPPAIAAEWSRGS